METERRLLFMDIRDKVIRKIQKKYIDFPYVLHEKNGDGTSGDLVIDEIAYLSCKLTYQQLSKKEEE